MLSPKVFDVLHEHSIPLIGDPIAHQDGDALFYLFVSVKRNKQGRQIPSNTSLRAAQREIKESLQLAVEFILVDGEAKDVEIGLRATLLHSFNDYVRNAFLSSSYGKARVWLDPKKPLDEEILLAVRHKASIYLKEVGMTVETVSSVVDELVPGNLSLLRTLRSIAPATLEELSQSLQSKEFTIPSLDWLSRRLDALRKSGHVIRLTNKSYALTLGSVRKLGTSRSPRSPDIGRLLAIAKKGRYAS